MHDAESVPPLRQYHTRTLEGRATRRSPRIFVSAPLPKQADGSARRWPATVSRATAERAATNLYAQRHNGAFNKAILFLHTEVFY